MGKENLISLFVSCLAFLMLFAGLCINPIIVRAQERINDHITEDPGVIHFDDTVTDNLSPDEVDLFYIPAFAGADTTNVDSSTQNSILQHIAAQTHSQELGGLGLSVHKITYDQAWPQGDNYRRIAQDFLTTGDEAYSIVLKEDADSPLRDPVYHFKQDLGNVPTHGTPESVDWGEIFTKRIADLLWEECNELPIDDITADVCVTEGEEDGLYGRALFNKFILHVYTHESGHMLGPLAVGCEENNYHTSDRKNPTVMDSAVVYYWDKKEERTVFPIYNGFRPEDQNAVRLMDQD